MADLAARPIDTPGAGRRLSRAERRAQLLATGRALVAERSFDEVTLDDLAEAAEVSRTLVFHYFANRNEFLAELVRAFAAEMLAATEPPEGIEPIAGLRWGVEHYLDFIADHAEPYRSMLLGAEGGAPALAAVLAETRATQTARILEGLGTTPEDAEPLVAVAARCWVSLVEEAAVALLEDDRVDRAALVERLLVTFGALLGFGPEDLAGLG